MRLICINCKKSNSFKQTAYNKLAIKIDGYTLLHFVRALLMKNLNLHIFHTATKAKLNHGGCVSTSNRDWINKRKQTPSMAAMKRRDEEEGQGRWGGQLLDFAPVDVIKTRGVLIKMAAATAAP